MLAALTLVESTTSAEAYENQPRGIDHPERKP